MGCPVVAATKSFEPWLTRHLYRHQIDNSRLYMVCSQQASGELLLPLFFLWQLAQAHPRAAAVLVDEFDAGRFQERGEQRRHWQPS